jgi:outer membrane protein
MDMQRRIQEFQNNAQKQLQDKQVELFQPIYAKVDKAIKDVGKENGFHLCVRYCKRLTSVFR